MGIADFKKPFELTELLGARLSIMNDAQQSIKYSLSASGTLPIDRNWSPYSSTNPSDKVFRNMRIYDAYLIDDRSKGPFSAFINPECVKMSKKILQIYIDYSGEELNDMVMQGYNNHKKFFEYLEDRFENDKDFDFS
jgi:acetone carboxylase gamma subunit